MYLKLLYCKKRITMKTINFEFQGQPTSFSYRKMESPINVENVQLTGAITCDHPAFIAVWGSPMVTGTSIGFLFEQGKLKNYSFFSVMQEAFMRDRDESVLKQAVHN
jgi:hypothetical protein